MPVGLGTRKCRRSCLLQEGSDANYELPELKFHIRLGSKIPSLPHLCWELRGDGARPCDGGAEGTCSTVPGFRELRLELPWPGCASQHSPWVQWNAQQFLPSWNFLLPLLETKVWEWETLAETGIFESMEPLTWFLHGANAWRTPQLPFTGLNLGL